MGGGEVAELVGKPKGGIEIRILYLPERVNLSW